MSYEFAERCGDNAFHLMLNSCTDMTYLKCAISVGFPVSCVTSQKMPVISLNANLDKLGPCCRLLAASPGGG